MLFFIGYRIGPSCEWRPGPLQRVVIRLRNWFPTNRLVVVLFFIGSEMGPSCEWIPGPAPLAECSPIGIPAGQRFVRFSCYVPQL